MSFNFYPFQYSTFNQMKKSHTSLSTWRHSKIATPLSISKDFSQKSSSSSTFSIECKWNHCERHTMHSFILAVCATYQCMWNINSIRYANMIFLQFKRERATGIVSAKKLQTRHLQFSIVRFDVCILHISTVVVWW